MTQKLILGLDIGTSSVRAALYDMRGELVPESLVKNERSFETTDDGGAEIDAELGVKQVIHVDGSVARDVAQTEFLAFIGNVVAVAVDARAIGDVDAIEHAV